MMYGLLRIGLVVLLPPLMAGCIYREATLSTVSIKALDVPVSIGKRVKGEDCLWFAVIFPVNGRFLVKYDKAIDKALEGSHGDFLVETEMYREFFHFLLGFRHCAVVEGTVASIKKSGTEAALPKN